MKKQEVTHRADETIVREVRDSDCDTIIEIFNYYAVSSYAAFPEIPVNDRFYAFLREGGHSVLMFLSMKHTSWVLD